MKLGEKQFSSGHQRDPGYRAVLEVIVKEGENIMDYKILVMFWKRSSFVLVVTDRIRPWQVLFITGLRVGRQGCLFHLKRVVTKKERQVLDAIVSSIALTEIKPENRPSKLPCCE